MSKHVVDSIFLLVNEQGRYFVNIESNNYGSLPMYDFIKTTKNLSEAMLFDSYNDAALFQADSDNLLMREFRIEQYIS